MDDGVSGPPAASKTLAPQRHCANCGSALVLNYCANCGQHAHDSARTLRLILHHAWHDLTHIDGRLWRTLGILVARPGQLTLEYFEGRRARYLPPVRLYLVVSILFFGLAFTGAQEPVQGTRPMTSSMVPTVPPVGDETRAAIARAAQGVPEARASGQQCNIELTALPRVTRALQASCRRAIADHGAAFKRTLTGNVPRTMFLFLPLLACAMKLLYYRPRRYLVEHLVFLLHNHSAIFASFIVAALTALLARYYPPAGAMQRLLSWVVPLYALWYTWSALRRYYRQGRVATLVKYVLVGLSYAVCLTITFLGITIWSALEA
jgi:hypothetical protein